MRQVEVYGKLSTITFADLKSTLATVRAGLARLLTSRIAVGPVSDEWRRENERESVKH